MIGKEFLSRLPPLTDLASQPGLAVRKFAQFAELTAGPEPIWGDINSGEDISAWQNAATALAQVRPDWEFAKRRLFGGGYENDNGLERIEAWHERFVS